MFGLVVAAFVAVATDSSVPPPVPAPGDQGGVRDEPARPGRRALPVHGLSVLGQVDCGRRSGRAASRAPRDSVPARFRTRVGLEPLRAGIRRKCRLGLLECIEGIPRIERRIVAGLLEPVAGIS